MGDEWLVVKQHWFRGDISIMFGDGILSDILSRLSVKSVLRYKAVCSRWCDLIKSVEFVSLHLTVARSQKHSLMIIVPEEQVMHFFSGRLSFNRVVCIKMGTTMWCHNTSKPINGLICSSDILSNSVCIYNISTLEYTPWITSLIKSERRNEAKEHGVEIIERPSYGFGFNPATLEHKVVCVWQIKRYEEREYTLIGDVEISCEVLTVGFNRWRRIDEVPPCKVKGPSVYANGSIIWRNAPADPWESPVDDFLVSFDVGSEKFRVIPIPNSILKFFGRTYHRFLHGPADKLLQVDGRIALVDRINEQTTKLWICDEAEHGTPTWIEESISMPLAWKYNHDLLFSSIDGTKQMIITAPPPIQYKDRNSELHQHLYLYERDKGIFRRIQIMGISPWLASNYTLNASFYVESLLPVHNQNSALDR